jgi:hypothetical protein
MIFLLLSVEPPHISLCICSPALRFTALLCQISCVSCFLPVTVPLTPSGTPLHPPLSDTIPNHPNTTSAPSSATITHSTLLPWPIPSNVTHWHRLHHSHSSFLHYPLRVPLPYDTFTCCITPKLQQFDNPHTPTFPKSCSYISCNIPHPWYNTQSLPHDSIHLSTSHFLITLLTPSVRYTPPTNTFLTTPPIPPQ